VIKIVLHTSKSFFVPAPHFPIDVPAHDLGRKYYREYNREPGGPIMPRETLRSRSRSRSPYRSSHLHPDHHDHHDRPRLSRERSRSPRRSHHHHHSRHDNKPSHSVTAPIEFPFKARNLSRHDLPTFRPMFALYLDVQKNILIEDLAEDEVKGRWKSFIGKW
jgi:peroxin-14